MPLLDIQQGRDLTGVPIADTVLQLLPNAAQTERELNCQCRAERIAAAKAEASASGRGSRIGAEIMSPSWPHGAGVRSAAGQQ